MEQNFKYFAFISYNSHDTKWGKRLQKRLEGYRMPATLCKEHNWKSKPIKPIFFAPTDIQPGGLSAELQERLRNSRNLIVIGSPYSASSEWVGKEIAYYHSIGRSENIYYFIIDGIPHSGNPETECLHPIIEQLGIPEILGVNIHEKVYRWPWLNKERAFIQLITKLLGIEYDSLWKRHRRLLIQKLTAYTIGAMMVIAALFFTWTLNQPVDIQLSIKEQENFNEALPPMKDATVTIEIGEEIKKDTITNRDDKAMFLHIPHRYLNQNVRVQISCKDYKDIDTTMVLSEFMTINMHRDAKVYGNVRFRLWDIEKECTVPNCTVYIDGNKAISDSNGTVSVTIPLSKQKTQYSVWSNEVQLLDSIVYVPCGIDDVICLKR